MSFKDILSKRPSCSTVKPVPQQDKAAPQDKVQQQNNTSPQDKTPQKDKPMPWRAQVNANNGQNRGSWRDVVRGPHNWITKCAKILFENAEGYMFVRPALRYTQRFIFDLCAYFDVEDPEVSEDTLIKYDEIVRNCIESLFSKDTTFKAVMLPENDAEHIEGTLYLIDGHEQAKCKFCCV